jgi:hypothetical protein
MHSAGM